MNRLQRRNQHVVGEVLGKPLLLKSVEVGCDRLVNVQTAAWEEYWEGCRCAPEEMQRLHLTWNALIAGDYSPARRSPFVQAYFALLRKCVDGYLSGDLDLFALKKVIGFETFSIFSDRRSLAAGTFNIRNPVYLLSRLALPRAPEDPKFLPLVCPCDDLGTAGTLFCHYRRIGMSARRGAHLFVYPPADARREPSSYRLIAELFASLTPKSDPWVQERTRLLFDGAFGDLVGSLAAKRIRLLDLACGSAKTALTLCRRASSKFGSSFNLTLVDVVRATHGIATIFYRNPRALGDLRFYHESLFEWLDRIPGDAPRRFDVAMMLRLCDIFSHLWIEGLSCREANSLIRREQGGALVDLDTAHPARLIEQNRLERLQHGLWRSPFRDGTLLHQFSLSDYYLAIKAILDGRESVGKGMIYALMRRFDESALVLPSGRSPIGQLLVMSDSLPIEDSELTADRLQEHIRLFGLSGLTVTDLSHRKGGRGAALTVVGRKHSHTRTCVPE